MYTMACTVVLFLTILGTEYSKNPKCYRNEKIVTHKIYKNKILEKLKIVKLKSNKHYTENTFLLNYIFNKNVNIIKQEE